MHSGGDGAAPLLLLPRYAFISAFYFTCYADLNSIIKTWLID